MPRVILHETAALIEKLPEGGEDYLFECIAGGETVVSICERVLKRSTGLFYEWAHMTDERWQKFKKARKLSAYAYAENGMKIVDEKASTPAAVARNRARSEYRRWLASKYNKEDFGEQPTTAVQVNFGMEHLQALEAAGGANALPPAQDIPTVQGIPVDE